MFPQVRDLLWAPPACENSQSRGMATYQGVGSMSESDKSQADASAEGRAITTDKKSAGATVPPHGAKRVDPVEPPPGQGGEPSDGIDNNRGGDATEDDGQ